jgi:hypothetical protein
MPTTSVDLTRLQALAHDPAAQAACAVTLLAPTQSRAAHTAALDVLSKHPIPEARPGLIALYQHLAENGAKRDAGAFLRVAIVKALRPVALPADASLLGRAATTVERMPPFFRDEATGLRAAALVALNEVDEQLAGFHATRLLVDEHVDPMSGEPAVSAARVLASQDQLLPLYLLAMQSGSAVPVEVIGECLRNLTGLPPSLVDGLVERYRDGAGAAVLIGLYDMLANHQSGPQALPFLESELTRLKDPDLYRYLLIALLSARKALLNELALRIAQLETDARKVAILLEMLAVFDLGPGAAELTRKLQKRARSRRS